MVATTGGAALAVRVMLNRESRPAGDGSSSSWRLVSMDATRERRRMNDERTDGLEQCLLRFVFS